MAKEIEIPSMSFAQRRITKFLQEVSLNYEAKNTHHLDEVRQLVDEGNIVVAELDHKSYADFGSGAAVVIKEGITDLVSQATLYVAEKYMRDPKIKYALKLIGVALGLKFQPLISHTMHDEKKKKEMNPKAIAEAQKKQTERPIGIIAPEGTRSRDGKMQPARYGAAAFWHGEGQRYILPIALEGTENQWPPDAGFRGLIFYLRKGKTENKIKVIFGKPVKVEALDNVAEVYAQGDPEKLKSLMVDIPMLLIARLHLGDDGDSNYIEGYYSDLKKQLDEHEISQGLRRLGYFSTP